MIYYIADMHFGHKNVIRFDNRPFADTDLMDEVLINNWNERVTEEDTVYVLGDAFWKNEEDSVSIIKRLHGHKHLIQGNHDRVHGRLRFHWESIRDYAEIDDNGRLVVLSHYPIPFYKNQHYGAVMLYGHVHNTREWKQIEEWRKELRSMDIPCRMFNVGCMMKYMRYTPRTLDEILEANPEPTEDEFIAEVSERILNRYRDAFAELAKGPEQEKEETETMKTEYPSVRNLDGVYNRVGRDGKFKDLAFTDLTEEEQERFLSRLDTEGLKRMVLYLAKVLREVGDELDIVRQDGEG